MACRLPFSCLGFIFCPLSLPLSNSLALSPSFLFSHFSALGSHGEAAEGAAAEEAAAGSNAEVVAAHEETIRNLMARARA